AGFNAAGLEADMLDPAREIHIILWTECKLPTQVASRTILASTHGQEIAARQDQDRGLSGEKRDDRNTDDPGIELAALVIRQVSIGKQPQPLRDSCVMVGIEVERLL